MTYKLSSRSNHNMVGVNGNLIAVASAAIQITTIDFGIPTFGGLRTAAQQRELYNEGRSKCDGYENKSYHQSGNALDFYAYIDGMASWDEMHLAMVAAAFLQSASQLGVKMRWGGLWPSFRDMPHVELAVKR